MNYKDLFRKYKKPSKKGFSLVELIATVAVIAITSGATISVFLMVQKVSNDASEITANQYNVSQMERIIRNELQVAADVDVDLLATFGTGGVHEADIEKNDEYMMYDPVRSEVVFLRADDAGTFKTQFSIEDVNEVKLSIAPLNDVVADKSNQPFKFFYTITTSHYDYSGGFVLSNTNIGNDDSMTYAGVKTKTINWKVGSPDNDYVLYFHRENTGVESTP